MKAQNASVDWTVVSPPNHKLVIVSCPVCRARDDFPIVRNIDKDGGVRKYGDIYHGLKSSVWCVCSLCGFVHQNPRPTLEALNQFYLTAGYHPQTHENYYKPDWYMGWARPYYAPKIDYAILHSDLQTGLVYELGFGHGGALKYFEEKGWRICGIEPDANHYLYAKDFLRLPQIQQGIFDSNTRVDEKVDLVWSNHTFEHIADLHEVMTGLTKIIKPGGFLFTAIPTYARNRSSLSRAWMNSGHYSMFTHRSFNHLISLYGFEEVTHSYRAWKQEVDDLWHLAQFTGRQTDPRQYYENPKYVRFDINIVNPIKAFFLFPFYGHCYTKRMLLPIRATKMLFKNPLEFSKKILFYLKRLKIKLSNSL